MPDLPADAMEAAARADYLRQFENSGIAAQAVIPHKLRAIGAENALADLRAGIEALRDEWRLRPGADYLHDHADALAALLRGA